MDLLIATISVLVLVASAIGSIFGNILAAELYDWCPKIARWFIGRAVARLPASVRSRYQEEWQAHLDECPANVSKLAHAFGCYVSVAAVALRVENEERRLSIEVAELLQATEAQEAFSRVTAIIERSTEAAEHERDKFFEEVDQVLAEYKPEHARAVSKACVKIFEFALRG